MSANLMWEPAKRNAKSLPDALKFIIRDSLEHGRKCFDESSLSYLHGLRDAKVEGAQELIDAIEKHETVELWLEY